MNFVIRVLMETNSNRWNPHKIFNSKRTSDEPGKRQNSQFSEIKLGEGGDP